MKRIMLVAFLIAAGCTRQLDCDAAVDQGIKRLTAGFRAYAPDPQTLENGTHNFEQIQGTLVRRCTVDRSLCKATGHNRAISLSSIRSPPCSNAQ